MIKSEMASMVSSTPCPGVSVLPDRSVRYESLAPVGRPHVAYSVEVTKPTPRDSDQERASKPFLILD